MKKLTILSAAALIAGTTFALAQGGAGGEPPKASDANPPAAVQGTPGESRTAPANDMRPGGAMKQTETGMPGGPGGSTPGTNSKAGTGAGTTGTGQKGGSGNQ